MSKQQATKRPVEIMIAQFGSTADLMTAAKKMREGGYKKYDCHSPFPVHGMDKAMGLKRSPLGYIVGLCGTCGLLFMIWLTWYASAYDYPLVISGKPFFSWQAYVPVFFAITVLASAFGAFLGMLAINKLPRPNHPLFNSDRFCTFSDDGFFVSVENDDPQYDPQKVRAYLESIGGKNVEIVTE
jgi:hypothetical protein